jgi:hypothetical protein
MRRMVLASIAGLLVAAAGGCGGSSNTASPPTTTATSPATTTSPARAATTASAAGPGALQAEANAAAAGDIPDNQVFLVFRNARAGYSVKYPEGWAQQGAAGRVVFRDKNNIVRIVVDSGGAPTPSSVRRQLHGVRLVSPAQPIRLPSGSALKVVYSTESTRNAVTGKRVTLVVDRYYLSHGGRRAIVDLGTPQGVDNVDAYRLMIESFRWM